MAGAGDPQAGRIRHSQREGDTRARAHTGQGRKALKPRVSPQEG
jgi:hypothetical protein